MEVFFWLMMVITPAPNAPIGAPTHVGTFSTIFDCEQAGKSAKKVTGPQGGSAFALDFICVQANGPKTKPPG